MDQLGASRVLSSSNSYLALRNIFELGLTLNQDTAGQNGQPACRYLPLMDSRPSNKEPLVMNERDHQVFKAVFSSALERVRAL